MTIRPTLVILVTLFLGVGPLSWDVCLAERPMPSDATDADDAPAGTLASSSALLKRRTAELTAALREYRESLERLLPMYEQMLARAVDKQRTSQDLYERGTISRRELERDGDAVATARSKVDQTTRELATAEDAIAEAAAVEALAALPPTVTDEPSHDAPLFRYQGRIVWTLQTITPKLQQMFVSRFGRPLPISAYGQTALHDRMGFDHSGALDVAVHPDSPEGRALIDYLKAEGLPFIAYRGAVAGAASGAHIHVGQPSPRIAVVTHPGPRRP
ncbi:MAG TPA: hypothetical protein VMS64_06440 [Candidatus Methylomirabilis sp.]|nr:hypothetical protein [Candidatus Methylomirabilis sp.]